MTDPQQSASFSFPPIAFIGGGNMASAIIGGLIRRGAPAAHITVVEPFEAQRQKLREQFGVQVLEAATAALGHAVLVVWAVKPQTFKDAAQQAAPHTQGALHLSVAAGIRSGSIAQWLSSERIVRAMPNTPALIAQGMTGLYARAAVTADERTLVEQVVATTGAWLWLEQETLLDAVTALSGSGPAYVFYFLEAMTDAGEDMGLTREQAHQLAVATFAGASELARRSDEPPAVLRQRVTSKGGTTHAAIESMEADDMAQRFMRALDAAEHRARELGDEFGATN